MKEPGLISVSLENSIEKPLLNSGTGSGPLPAGVRRAMARIEAYRPGQPIADLLREISSLRRSKIIKLASNENPAGPSPKAVAAARRVLEDIHRYPESSSPLLRHRLASNLKLGANSIIVTNGADEALRLAVETVFEEGDAAVISQFAFPRFRQHAALMGARVVETSADRFGHDLAAMARAAIECKAKAVFIANPNNPTGTFNTKAQWRDFIKRLLPYGGSGGPDGPEPWVILDEAYFDFAKGAQPGLYPMVLPNGLAQYPKLIVIRTMSKIAGLAGLRVGYLAAHPGLTEIMHRARLVFNVNLPAQAAALASLGDPRHAAKTLRIVGAGRRFLTRELERLGFRVVTPNAANFLLAQVPGGSAEHLYRKLLPFGIILRPADCPGLERHIRISIGTASENKALIRQLTKLNA